MKNAPLDIASMKRGQLEVELLGEHIATQAAHLDAATHRLLTDIRAFDTAGGWFRQGARSCAAWLSWRVGWDGRTARDRVRVANRLGELPLVDDALRRGELSYSKVRAITRVATPVTENTLVEYARHTTGAQLERICRMYAAVIKHDDDTKPADDRARRVLRWHTLEDGMVQLVATFHPEEAAIVKKAIERVAAERCRKPAADDQAVGATKAAVQESGSAEPQADPSGIESSEPVRPPFDGLARARELREEAQQKRFDRAGALFEIAQDVVRGTAKQRAPIDLVVTTTMEVLLAPQPTRESSKAGVAPGQDVARWPATRLLSPDPTVGVVGDTCISATAVRRIACDCALTRVVEDERGNPLAIERKTRTIPGAIKSALLRLDQTCRFPGCTAQAFLEGHHVKHWAEGGTHALTNLLCLCGWHHRFVHEYGFQISMNDYRDVTVIDPLGRKLVNVPARHVGPVVGYPMLLAANANLAITAETPACGWTGESIDYAACVDGVFASERQLAGAHAARARPGGSAEPDEVYLED